MGESANTLANILTNIGAFFTQLISWFGALAETIVSNPILFIFLVAVPVVGIVIGFILRLVRSRGR